MVATPTIHLGILKRSGQPRLDFDHLQRCDTYDPSGDTETAGLTACHEFAPP